MPIPTFFKCPFIETTDIVYSRVDLYNQICMNDLLVVPFKDINIRKHDPNRPRTKINKGRILTADTRYPGIVYYSKLDPLRHETVLKDYCIFDGTHRLMKMLSEGKTASVFYLLTPDHFKGLTAYPHYHGSQDRTTGCGGCLE